MKTLFLLIALCVLVAACSDDEPTGPAKFHAGNFQIDSLIFSINSTTGDGSSWDIGGSAPDPIITVYRNDAAIFSTQVDDMLSGTIAVDHRINLQQGDYLQVQLLDEDTGGSDFIGLMGIDAVDLFGFSVGQSVPLTAIGNTVSMKSASLVLRQVQ